MSIKIYLNIFIFGIVTLESNDHPEPGLS